MASISDRLFKDHLETIKELAQEYDKLAKSKDPETLEQLKGCQKVMKKELKALNELLKDPVKNSPVAKDTVKTATELCKKYGVTL